VSKNNRNKPSQAPTAETPVQEPEMESKQTDQSTADEPIVDAAPPVVDGDEPTGTGDETPVIAEETPAVVVDEPAAEAPPATPEPVVEPVVTPAPEVIAVAPPAPAAPVVESTPVDTTGDVYDHLRATFPGVTEYPPVVTNAIKFLDEYVKLMAPNTVMNKDRGTQQQRALYSTVMNALEVGAHNELVLEAVLYYFHKHRAGAFGVRLLFRYLPELRVSALAMKGFQAVLHVFQTAGERAGRDARLKTIDFNKVIPMLTGTQAERLLSFFRVKG